MGLYVHFDIKFIFIAIFCEKGPTHSLNRPSCVVQPLN
jgi:hypothetical protein